MKQTKATGQKSTIHLIGLLQGLNEGHACSKNPVTITFYYYLHTILQQANLSNLFKCIASDIIVTAAL